MAVIVSPDKSRRVDPVVENFIKHIDSPIPVVPVTRLENFEFNDDLLNLDRYWVVDMVEYGWDWEMETTHLFGRNTYSEYFKHLFIGDEWKRFDDFIRDRQPIMYMKRELLSKDRRQNVMPIEYPALNKIPEPQTKDEFNSRVLQVANIWGLSHERRKDIHGDIWKQAGRHGYVVCDNLSIFHSFAKNETNHKKWLTQNTPWYARYEMDDILNITGFSKISCSWGGAGRKCFRHTETVNSTMAMWEDGIEWTWPWLDNVNCIKCEEGKEVDAIAEALNNPYLYEIYRACISTQEKYFLPNYINHYLNPLIHGL